MKSLRAFFFRLLGILPSHTKERELSEELESHLNMHIDDNLRAGMTPKEARRKAVLHLGGVAQTKEAWRDRRSLPVIENRLLDLRFAVRQLRKNPGFAATAVLMVCLGICGSVSIFAFVDAALLKPLPYKDSGRLLGVYERSEGFTFGNLSYLDFLDWKEQNTVFESLEAYRRTGYRFTTASGVEATPAAAVSAGFFRALGVAPILGRDFRKSEDKPGGVRLVILSYAAWQQRFNGSPDVLARKLIFNGKPYEIIGVLPREFHFAPAEPAPFWTPEIGEGSCAERRSCHNMYGIGRLKPGESQGSAQAQLVAIAKRLEQQYPGSNTGQGAGVALLSERIAGGLREILLVLLGGSLLLLLIATINVASLLLVRSEVRGREIAVRGALGASAGRLFSQFMTEGILLVFLGAAAGLGLASLAVRALPTLIPIEIYERLPYLHHIGPNFRVAAFAVAIVLLAIALFSLTPVLRSPLMRMREDLAEGGRSSADNSWRRLGSRLVVVELAMAIVLLVSAALLSQSLYRLLQVNPGLEVDRLAAIQVGASPEEYKSRGERINLAGAVLNAVRAIPGVAEAGIASQLPVTHNGNTTWFRVEGRPHNGGHEEAPQRDVSLTYFQTIGARMELGRSFEAADAESKWQRIVVNQAMAKKYFPGEDPVGRHLTNLDEVPERWEIIGVVEDLKEGPLGEPTPPIVYFSYERDPYPNFVVFLRTALPEEAVLPALERAVKSSNAGLVTRPPVSMREHIAESQSVYLNRSTAALVGSFAAISFLLSVIGLYGVIAYSVSRRNREIGVRMALGARQSNVYELILREAGMLAALGVGLGLLFSVAAANLLQGMLFGVKSWDIPTLVAVAAVVAAAALLASFLPARRAAGINPIEALRGD